MSTNKSSAGWRIVGLGLQMALRLFIILAILLFLIVAFARA